MKPDTTPRLFICRNPIIISANSMTDDTGKEPSGAKGDTTLFGKTAVAVIIVFFAVLVIAFVVWLAPTSVGQQVSSQACGNKVLQYVNQNLVQPGSQASLNQITEVNGVYEISLQYNAQLVSLYATRTAPCCSPIITI